MQKEKQKEKQKEEKMQKEGETETKGFTVCKKELGSFHLMVKKSREDLNLYCLDAYPCSKCLRCVMCNISDTCMQCYASKEQKMKDDRRKVSVDLRKVIRQESQETIGYHPSSSQLKKITRSQELSQKPIKQEENKNKEENKDYTAEDGRNSIAEKRKSKSMAALLEDEVD
jgi:hypothetical protein